MAISSIHHPDYAKMRLIGALAQAGIRPAAIKVTIQERFDPWSVGPNHIVHWIGSDGERHNSPFPEVEAEWVALIAAIKLTI